MSRCITILYRSLAPIEVRGRGILKERTTAKFIMYPIPRHLMIGKSCSPMAFSYAWRLDKTASARRRENSYSP